VIIVHVLHEEMLAKVGPAFERGRAYFEQRRVRAVSAQGGKLTGMVTGKTNYEVAIWASETRLGYSCSCPSGADGFFCKHAVAVALAWLDRVQHR
jgi:uncharacterized Zn finger protein